MIYHGLREICLGCPQGVLKQRRALLEVAQGGREGHRDLRSVDDMSFRAFHPIVEVTASHSLAASHTRCIVSEARTPSGFWREGAQGCKGRWTHLHIHV